MRFRKLRIAWSVVCDFGLRQLAETSQGFCLAVLVGTSVVAQSPPSEPVAAKTPAAADDNPADVLTPNEWKQVDIAVERALCWLAAQQQENGSFPTIRTGQPGVTSLCIMAFAAHGHTPGDGPYGERLARAADYVLSCQKENGLITLLGPDGPRITRQITHVCPPSVKCRRVRQRERPLRIAR